MQLQTFVDRLDDRLDTAAYADLDASANGLQVGPDEATVDRVAVAVDAAAATIDEAIDRNADVLVVHHGISWGGFERITGREYRLIDRLVENDIALYAAHLPLDGHQELGNAAGVAAELGLVDREPFGRLGPEYVGQRGRFDDPTTAESIAEALDEFDGTATTAVLDFGPEQLTDVGIVTGSGTDWLDEAIDADLDALLTGEGKQKVYHQAREASITVFLAGHYATETFGVRSIASLAEEWGLSTTFVAHPTGI
ncbi:MAG: Nif3-like dinuclear metal center hexameric protein [Halobacteriota archaeon]